jgi:hypothetical protein
VKQDFTASISGPTGPVLAPLFLIPRGLILAPAIFSFRGPCLALVQVGPLTHLAIIYTFPSQPSQPPSILRAASFIHFSYESYICFAMEITLAFAIALGGIFLSLALFKLRHRIKQFLKAFSLWTYKHFVYPQFVRRYRYLGPWSRADILLQSIYIAANIFCLSFRVPSISKAGLRAANLSLINLIPLFSSLSFNVLTDFLGISLGTFRQFHRSAGVMSFVLLVFHVVTAIAGQPFFSLHVPENLWGVIVSFNHFYRMLAISNSA